VSNLANDDFCAIGRAALDAVLATVISGRLSHRSFHVRHGCRPRGRLRNDQPGHARPRAVAALSTAGPIAGWCRVHLAQRLHRTAVVPETGFSTQPVAPYEKRVEIAGRPSMVTNFPTVQCRVVTVGHALGVTDLHGKQTREVFAVSVYAPLDDTTRCQIARKVAARAWSRLPR
jgi:hypothetical protein